MAPRAVLVDVLAEEARVRGLNAQGYFSHDYSHKEMGAAISHLRFGEKPIRAHYMTRRSIAGADLV